MGSQYTQPLTRHGRNAVATRLCVLWCCFSKRYAPVLCTCTAQHHGFCLSQLSDDSVCGLYCGYVNSFPLQVCSTYLWQFYWPGLTLEGTQITFLYNKPRRICSSVICYLETHIKYGIFPSLFLVPKHWMHTSSLRGLTNESQGLPAHETLCHPSY